MNPRSCQHDYPIHMFRAPYGVKELALIGVDQIEDRFCVLSHNVIVYQGNDFPSAEKALVKECKKYHKTNQAHSGRMKIGKAVYKNGKMHQVKLDLPVHPSLRKGGG